MPTVYVKFQAQSTPMISFQDKDGNALGTVYAGMSGAAAIVFKQADGSDPFFFKSFFASQTAITCPPTGTSATEFQVTALAPPAGPTQMTVTDQNTDSRQTVYYYAVQICPQSDPTTSYWSDPEIVNHAESPSPGEIPAVRVPDDMPAIAPRVERATSSADVGAPPPA